MRRLLLLLAGGTLGFIAVAMLQEREVFLRPWFKPPAEAPEGVSREDAAKAEAAVRELLSLMRHLHASGGDARFSERMPASDRIRAEAQADADYVRASVLRQQMDLVRLDVLGVDAASPGRITVRTREYWQVRWLTPSGAASFEPAHAEVALGRYLLERQAERFIVTDWGPADPQEQGTP